MKIFKIQDGGLIEEIDPRSGKVEPHGLEEIVPNTVEAAVEQHVPIIEKVGDGVIVKVGSTPHPMEPDHYIMWIETRTENHIFRKYLKPCDKPEARFPISSEGLSAYAYCNIHGLWKSE